MELSFKLSKPALLVYDHLSDMQKFVTVHPIIYKIEPLGKDHYLIYEKLKLFLIPANFTYKVLVESDPDKKTVNYKARINALTKIEMQFCIKEESGGCIVNEVVDFKSYLPVKAMMKNIFRIQHKLLFDNINNL
jgi:carbon monoxide dehydrogenase subunit G